jgi:hypothetical protein
MVYGLWFVEYGLGYVVYELGLRVQGRRFRVSVKIQQSEMNGVRLQGGGSTSKQKRNTLKRFQDIHLTGRPKFDHDCLGKAKIWP